MSPKSTYQYLGCCERSLPMPYVCAGGKRPTPSRIYFSWDLRITRLRAPHYPSPPLRSFFSWDLEFTGLHVEPVAPIEALDDAEDKYQRVRQSAQQFQVRASVGGHEADRVGPGASGRALNSGCLWRGPPGDHNGGPEAPRDHSLPPTADNDIHSVPNK